MDDVTQNSLIGAGLKLGGELLAAGGKALMGLYRSPEEVRTEMLNVTTDFLSYIREGGEMDQRAKAARDATDAAIKAAEDRQAAIARAERDTDPGIKRP
jgi:hypothetical protein